jgi:hypothetical protein
LCHKVNYITPGIFPSYHRVWPTWPPCCQRT